MLSYYGITVVLPDKGGFSKAASFCHDHFPTTQRPFTKAIARLTAAPGFREGARGCFSVKCKLPGPEVTAFPKEKCKAFAI